MCTIRSAKILQNGELMDKLPKVCNFMPIMPAQCLLGSFSVAGAQRLCILNIHLDIVGV